MPVIIMKGKHIGLLQEVQDEKSQILGMGNGDLFAYDNLYRI